MSDDKYDEDYFIRGKESGKSLYENYRWLPELTIPMCQRIIDYCGIQKGQSILDFGCARGYSVRALRELGHDAWGVDVSQWAIENCDDTIKSYVKLKSKEMIGIEGEYDWIIAKDVLEHVHYIKYVVDALMSKVKRGLFVVVPLCEFSYYKYVIKEYEEDVTHVQRYSLPEWLSIFLRPGWSVEASYRVKGIKDNYYKPGWEKGNGFILCKRTEV